MIHQSLTFQSPRYILTSVYFDVFPKGFACRLHSFFHGTARFPLTIHHTSKYLEFFFKRKFVTTFRGTPNHILLFFRSVRARPPQVCWLGLQIHFRRFFNEVFQHLLQVFLGVGHDPEVVGPHETANLMLSSSSFFNFHKNTFSLLHPFFFHVGQYWGCHLLSQAWCFHASLSQAAIECETAFHTFKHGLSRESRHLTQEGGNDPSVCIVTVQVSHVQCWSDCRPVFHHGSLSHPPMCSFFHFSGSFLSLSKRNKMHDAYHFDITDVSAIAL